MNAQDVRILDGQHLGHFSHQLDQDQTEAREVFGFNEDELAC